jgi:tetratricopeptide (TPR) repeat protein
MNRLFTAAAAAGAALLLLPSAFAQTGMARGRVLDDKGQPVAGAKVQWEFLGGMSRKGEVTTNKKGEFVQVGLQPGQYRFTANMEGFQPQFSETRIGLGDPTMVPDFKLVPRAAAAAADPGLAALKASVEQAIALASSGKTDEALALYTDLAAKNPSIHQIPYNMAGIYMQRKDWANAEASYKKSLEVKPDYTEALVGLSNLYMNTGRSGEAAELMGKAVAANPAENRLLLQQGVIFFNSGKQAEAAEVFEKLVAADPTSPEPYYFLGTIAVGQGKTSECIAHLEKYLSLNPTNATNIATAKGLLAALKR